MKLELARSKMTEIAEGAAERLRALGVEATVEFDYMDGMLRSVEPGKRVRYLTVSVIIAAEGIAKGEEYCLSLGAMLRRGEIDEEMLTRDSDKFNEMINDTVKRLEGAESVTEVIKQMTTEAEAECEKLLEKLEADNKRNRRISTISSVVIFVIIIAVYVIFMLVSGNGT